MWIKSTLKWNRTRAGRRLPLSILLPLETNKHHQDHICSLSSRMTQIKEGLIILHNKLMRHKNWHFKEFNNALKTTGLELAKDRSVFQPDSRLVLIRICGMTIPTTEPPLTSLGTLTSGRFRCPHSSKMTNLWQQEY